MNQPKIAAFTGLDGYTYIVRHDLIDSATMVYGANMKNKYNKPVLIENIKTGPSISSPLVTNHRIIICGYQGIYLYSYDNNLNISKLVYGSFTIEASTVLWGNKVFIATRGGFLYCLGENSLK